MWATIHVDNSQLTKRKKHEQRTPSKPSSGAHIHQNFPPFLDYVSYILIILNQFRLRPLYTKF